jgi:hypothetical protein
MPKRRVKRLGDDLLAAVRRYPDDATASVSRPQGTVRLRQNAFGALQIVPDVLNIGGIDLKTDDWIVSHYHVSFQN